MGADVVLLAEETLAGDAPKCLIEVLRPQPSWSDLPILLLANEEAESTNVCRAVELLGNVTVLERPVRTTVLVRRCKQR